MRGILRSVTDVLLLGARCLVIVLSAPVRRRFRQSIITGGFAQSCAWLIIKISHRWITRCEESFAYCGCIAFQVSGKERKKNCLFYKSAESRGQFLEREKINAILMLNLRRGHRPLKVNILAVCVARPKLYWIYDCNMSIVLGKIFTLVLRRCSLWCFSSFSIHSFLYYETI